MLISLTAKGRQLVRRIAPLVEREYQALEAAIGGDLVREAYALVDRLSATLRAAATGADSPRARGRKSGA